MKINNVDIATLGLTLLQGSEESLFLPAKPKAVRYNSNRAIDGQIPVLPALRRLDKREIVLKFKFSGSAGKSLQTALEELNTLLIKGVNNTGVTEMTLNESTSKLIFKEISKYAWFGESCLITVKFDEYNPANRL